MHHLHVHVYFAREALARKSRRMPEYAFLALCSLVLRKSKRVSENHHLATLVMDRLGKLIESITKPRYEEDFIDRLNYRVTSYILLAAAFTIIAKISGLLKTFHLLETSVNELNKIISLVTCC